MNYYHFNKLKTYNADVMIAVSSRTNGKSFDVKVDSLYEFLKYKWQTLWSMRTEAMLDESIQTFMEDVLNAYLGNWDDLDDITKKKFKFIGNRIFDFKIVGRYLKYKDEYVIYFKSINTAMRSKGTSSKAIRRFVFDEFIDENGEYLKNEVTKFCSLLFTAVRNRNGKIYLLGNALSFDNPYFKLFRIKFPRTGNIYKSICKIKTEIEGVDLEFKLVCVCEFVKTDDKLQLKNANSIAGLVSLLSKYGKSAVENKFYLDNNSGVVDIKNIKQRMIPSFNLIVDKTKICVYTTENNFIFVGDSPKLSIPTYVYNDVEEVVNNKDYFLINKKHYSISLIQRAVVNELIIFNDIEKKNLILNLLNKII